jgi:hypothetical protein
MMEIERKNLFIIFHQKNDPPFIKTLYYHFEISEPSIVPRIVFRFQLTNKGIRVYHIWVEERDVSETLRVIVRNSM